MASYLGMYRTAAKDRDKKIVRAINSILDQSFHDLEVVVIADGCQQTVDIVNELYFHKNETLPMFSIGDEVKLKNDSTDMRVRCILIEKSKLWSGDPRNRGLENALGEFITYLDIDDIYGKDHLKNINDQLGTCDWVWFDDVRFSPKTNEWYQNSCDIHRIGKHGTSNICHKRSLTYRWMHNGYAHDHYFIKMLKQNMNYKKIPGGDYYVCHIPDSNLGKGYDL
jgi:glycosyltransferase involved in cell wall biosynthesis